ncbi:MULTISPECIES: ABC transporter permease [unclassified Leucobacter]|uniref:ABC transporter permease n=1 Tax=unclassified Leucobacter TaxID=2621730 RepID=UPI00165D98F4|nr:MULTISPECIES: ABC transporter permease [unclassified Leucobacter]MBC9928624.1 ABC transporter permease [Leucobacter sp. cx-169]MBC9937555.1 ABC transporter permease [Leucobacter sp. cx-87]
MDRMVNGIARAVFVFLYIPICAVIVYSFNAAGTSTRFEGLTLQWYVDLFQDEQLMTTLRTSAIVGVLAATLATAIGIMFALGLQRYRGKGKTAMIGMIALPLIVPEIVLGVALLSVFSSTKVPLGILTLVLGHLIVALPLATLVLMSSASMLDPSLPEAATDLGCTPWQTFTRVYFPLLRPAVMAAWLLSFTTSFSNIVMSTFLSGVGSTTLPLKIYSSLKTGLTPSINALGALLILLTLVIVLSVGIRQMRRILVDSRS